MNNSNTLSSIELAEILNTSHEYALGMILDMLLKLYDGHIPSELLGKTIDLDYGHLLVFVSDLKGNVRNLLLKICKELKYGTYYTAMEFTR